MNRVEDIRCARMRQNCNFGEQASYRVTFTCSSFKGIHFKYSNDLLDLFVADSSSFQSAWTEQVADDVLSVRIPDWSSEAPLTMMLHRLDFASPSIWIRFLLEKNSKRRDTIELHANCFRVGQVEEFTFSRLENLALSLVITGLAHSLAVDAERP